MTHAAITGWGKAMPPAILSNADLSAIVERYYDEEKFLRQLLRETMQAKRDGQVSPMEILVRPKKSEVKRETNPETEEDNASPS